MFFQILYYFKEDSSNNATIDVDDTNTTDDSGMQRIQISNLPPSMKFNQVKMFIEKKLSHKSVKKLRYKRDSAYMSFDNEVEAQKAVNLLDGYTMKGHILRAKFALPEPRKGIEPRVCYLFYLKSKFLQISTTKNDNNSLLSQKSARDIVTPLWNMLYDEQIQLKQCNAEQNLRKIYREFQRAGIARQGVDTKVVLQTVS